MPLRFTLRQIEYLVAVADSGSVAMAAERLHVSPPSVSAAIGQLEDEFGLQLFMRRHAQGLSLTEAGRECVEVARQILVAAERLQDRASDLTGKVSGRLAVGCLLTFAQVLLPHLRRSFTAAHDQVIFRQSELDHAALVDALRHGVLDVALSYDMPLPPDMGFVPLVALPPYALFDPDHPLATRDRVTADDLLPHPMVLLDLPYSSDYFLSFFTPQKPHIAERTRDMGVMRSMVANGFGYSIANIRSGSNLAPDGRHLVFVPIKTGLPAMRLGLIVPAQAGQRRTVAAFVAHCRATVTTDALPGMTTPDA